MTKIYVIIVLIQFVVSDWGSTGHRAIAEVASNYLTENSIKKINKILDGETLVNVSTYADDIKSDIRYD